MPNRETIIISKIRNDANKPDMSQLYCFILISGIANINYSS
jgi:hypothetical protein